MNGFQFKDPLECNKNIPEVSHTADSDTILEKLVFEDAESKRSLTELSDWIKYNMVEI